MEKNDKNKQITQWILIVAIALIILAIIDFRLITSLPKFATFGVSTAIFDTYPNAIDAKVFTFISIGLCFCMGYFGIKHRQNIWAKLLVMLACLLWCFVGFIGALGAWG